jgi:hypothetical protein
MTSFYLTGVSSCSICHYTCKTCSGPANTQCIKCHNGGNLTGGVCVANTTYAYAIKVITPVNATNVTWTPTMTGNTSGPISTSDCNNLIYLFGYHGYSGLASLFGTANLKLFTTHISIT